MSALLGIVKIPDLRKKIGFTLMMLVIYRLGVHIPTPGVDGAALAQVFSNVRGTIFDWFNFFSGGALERFSILALGVSPYITSSILFQLLVVGFPALAELKKDGAQGRKKITQYTRYGAVFFCIVQGFALATAVERQMNPPVVLFPGLAFKFMTISTMTAGTLFLIWLGEQITERGIGNGISVIIYASIAARIPQGIINLYNLYHSNELSFFKLLFVVATALVAFFGIVLFERATRRISIHYAKRIVGRKIYGGQDTHIPLKLNSAGVMPPIFAQSVLMFPATIATLFSSFWVEKIQIFLDPSKLFYNVLFVVLIVFFSYFYTQHVSKTEDISDDLKKYNGFVPGIRPGQQTSDYLDYVLNRITLVGAVYIAVICVVPMLMVVVLKTMVQFGGTSLLILVGVALDTMTQVETYLLSKNYESFSTGRFTPSVPNNE